MDLNKKMLVAYFSHKGENYSNGRIVELKQGNTAVVADMIAGLDHRRKTMKYAKLGTSGIEVSRLCVGCMSFGDPASKMHAWTLDPTESETIIKHALELGINFFDTANCYSAGTSEEYLGKAIKHNVSRDKAVIATKVYFNEGNLSKEAIPRELDGSLKRLGTDYVDLLIIHRFDYHTPEEETMEALHKAVQSGKVRAIGASAMYGYQFARLQN